MKLFYPTPTPSKLLPYLAVGAVALIALALLDASLFNEAQAAIGKGGADPFTAATAKADEATTYLTGTIAISITAMVIAVTVTTTTTADCSPASAFRSASIYVCKTLRSSSVWKSRPASWPAAITPPACWTFSWSCAFSFKPLERSIR